MYKRQTEADLPITSSSVDFDGVSIKRKSKFSELVDANTPTLTQLKDFHFSKETEGKNSVNMERVDAQTVSVSHISVNHDIQFNYIDNVVNEEHSVTINKVS